ncbi:MAG: winged helix-turn-helix transcriptional regulator [Candidatus Heimdallarchaeota archaeon]|nr:winged helix-turn-helix transcriptional regulator [Candidatus Heimdallarchaeota archaeon]
MRYILDDKDKLIFNELYINPFQTYNSLSKKIKIAPATVKDRVMNMKVNGFIRADREINDGLLGLRIQSEVVASYFPPSIGLVRLNVLFDNIPDAQSLKKLIDFCDEHPYTHYRGQSFKNSVSLYAQFDIPKGIVSKMELILQEIRNLLNIEEILILPCSNYSYSYPDFSKIINGGNWNNQNIDTKDYLINKLWVNYLSKSEQSFVVHETDKQYVMSQIDAKLLRELTINAKVPLKFLSKTYNLSNSVISRYLSKIKQNIIYRGILLYDESFFGMNNLQVIFGKFSRHSELNDKTLIEFFKSSSLPLLSNIYCNKDNYVVETIASPLASTEMAKFLWQNTAPNYFKVNQLHVPNTLLYYFYHKNYIAKNTWNIEDDYIHQIPLNKIE